METTYLDAKTFGIGQLITQRKLFRVPEHQRNFSWESSNVEQIFEDITKAIENDDPDYFIGLIVLLGPINNAWQILDGQQRLATVTMIFSAIRHWLVNREDYIKDAEQIESEFIGVRQLGGAYSPRLNLNIENHDTFIEIVVQRFPDEEMIRRLRNTPKHSSNHLLVEAALMCRQLINSYASEGATNIEQQANRLFNLSSYLEERVKVVVLDAISEANAFIIFEALNARGNELSVLDLVKNHIFGNAGPKGVEKVRPKWLRMAAQIEDKNADDFLKVFWTSRFGRVQKPQLYARIKEEFSGQSGALDLASELATASEYYIALDDPKHEIWSRYGSACSEKIRTLTILGNRQVRAPILSAIDSFDKEKMESLLWFLIVLTIRYQIVGQRRTGALEIACARMANLIWEGRLQTDKDLWIDLRAIIPGDEEFKSDFLRFSENKASRVAYFLAKLEKTFREREGLDTSGLDDVAHNPSNVVVDFILPKNPIGGWQDVLRADPGLLEERLYRIGNRCLLEVELDDYKLKPSSFENASSYYIKSKFLLTKILGSSDHKWDRGEIEKRQALLAELAISTWPLPAKQGT